LWVFNVVIERRIETIVFKLKVKLLDPNII
jgi:hypothetical protein